MEHPKNEVVTARVIFKGLMLGCINTDIYTPRYEMGMIPCPEHIPSLKTRKNNEPAQPLEWPEGHDLIIKVVNPVQDGVRLHAPDPDVYEAGFKFALDVEGPDLHRRGIKVNTGALAGRRIGVTAGLFYTHELTAELDLFTWAHSDDRGTPVKHFGAVAKQTGANIVCQEGESNGVKIIDAFTGDALRCLPALPGVSYEIVVDNDCFGNAADQTSEQRAAIWAPVGSDFRFLYQVMRPIDPFDMRKFDFGPTFPPGLPRKNEFRSPDTCNPSTGGGRKSIGLDWSHV